MNVFVLFTNTRIPLELLVPNIAYAGEGQRVKMCDSLV